MSNTLRSRASDNDRYEIAHLPHRTTLLIPSRSQVMRPSTRICIITELWVASAHNGKIWSPLPLSGFHLHFLISYSTTKFHHHDVVAALSQLSQFGVLFYLTDKFDRIACSILLFDLVCCTISLQPYWVWHDFGSRSLKTNVLVVLRVRFVVGFLMFRTRFGVPKLVYRFCF